MFSRNGYDNINVVGDSTAISGTQASDWSSASELQVIADALIANPELTQFN